MVVISDGNDTNSRATMRELKQEIRESEVLIYAIGIDSQAIGTRGGAPPPGSYPPGPGPRMPVPLPFPSPGGGRRVPQPPASTPPPMPPAGGSVRGSRLDDRVNVAALRDITDDSGGRTEIVRRARSRSGNGERRRRVEQAVLPGVPVAGQARRPLAHHPGRTACRRPSGARAPRLRRHAVAARRSATLNRAGSPEPCSIIGRWICMRPRSA